MAGPSASLESLVHEAYVAHYGSVAGAFQTLDGVIQDEYAKVAGSQADMAIDSGVFHFYYTGDGYIDPQTLYCMSVHSARKDRTGLIDGMPRPEPDANPVPDIIEQAYGKLVNIATSDSDAAGRLKKIFERAFPDEVGDGPIAVRKPLYVFRLAQGDMPTDRRARYAGDTVALPEIVNPKVTELIGKQVVAAQAIVGSLAGNSEVAKAVTIFRSLHHELSRSGDDRDPFWAPLRTYKEGIVTAAQAVSFLSEGITDEAAFLAALAQWRQDKTLETIASCISGTILGPLATHGAQPKGELVRAPSGAMRQDLKAAMQAISRERKQEELARSVRAVSWAGIETATFAALAPTERAKRLIEKQRFFLPGWGCLAPASVVRRSADIALAQVA